MLSVVPTTPDNPFKAAMRRNAYMAASILARYSGDEPQNVLTSIANEYTEIVASKTLGHPPFLTFQQIALDPNFQDVFKRRNVKTGEHGVTSVGGFGIKDELINGVPNTFLYSGLASVAFLGYRYWAKKRGKDTIF